MCIRDRDQPHVFQPVPPGGVFSGSRGGLDLHGRVRGPYFLQKVEYLLDVLLFGETEEKAALITDYGKDVIQLEQRMAELAAANAARTKKHHERHAAATERP